MKGIEEGKFAAPLEIRAAPAPLQALNACTFLELAGLTASVPAGSAGPVAAQCRNGLQNPVKGLVMLQLGQGIRLHFCVGRKVTSVQILLQSG
jgi:hypothetical protein